MVRRGKVFGNLMVDLQVTCAKLQDRGERMLMETLDMDRSAAQALLDAAGGSVKRALVMHLREVQPGDADRLLEEVDGVLARVIKPGQPGRGSS